MKPAHLIVLFSVTFSMLCQSSHAQLTEKEKERIAAVDFHDHTFDPRRPTFMKIGNNAVTRYNPVSLMFSGSLFIYQKFISPQLQSNCPYQVSCSAFSKQSIEEFGLIKGIGLTVDRLSRCTQFTNIDLLPSQIDRKTGRIVDDLDKYRLREHSH